MESPDRVVPERRRAYPTLIDHQHARQPCKLLHISSLSFVVDIRRACHHRSELVVQLRHAVTIGSMVGLSKERRKDGKLFSRVSIVCDSKIE